MKKYFTLFAVILSFGSISLAQNKSEDEAKIKALLLKEVDALNKTQNLDEYMAVPAFQRLRPTMKSTHG